MKFVLVFCLCALSQSILICRGQTPNWTWVQSAIGAKADYILCSAVGDNGSVYIAGQSSSPTLSLSNIDIDNPNTYKFIFLAKYNSHGSVLWTKRILGTGGEEPMSIAADSLGNCYLAGYFQNWIVIDGDTLFHTTSNARGFILKCNSNGQIIWKKTIKGNGAIPNAVCVDRNENIYLAGRFPHGTALFDTIALTTFMYPSLFLAKYDKNGNARWAKTAYGADRREATAVCVDDHENVYITGNFCEALILGGDTLTSNGTCNMFLSKYNSEGNVIWGRGPSTTNDIHYSQAGGIATDSKENIYVVGTFGYSKLSLDSVVLLNSSLLGTDVYIGKYDSTGKVVWAKSGKGKSDDYDTGSFISVDREDNVVLAGIFPGPELAFDSIILPNDSCNVTNGTNNFYVAQFSSDGIAMWAKSIKGAGFSYNLRHLKHTIDNNGNIYLVMNSNLDSMCFGDITIYNSGTKFTTEGFLCRLGNVSTSISSLLFDEQLRLFPNPATSQLFIQTTDFHPQTLSIFDMSGRKVMEEKYSPQIDISALQPGGYFIELRNEETVVRKRWVKGM